MSDYQTEKEKVVLKTTPSSPEGGLSDSSFDGLPDLGARYEVHECLGRGGMGAVYKIYDKDLACFLAAKVIRQELAENAQAVKRFEQEIRAASNLSHENLVHVYGGGRSEANVPYMLMDFIDGVSLSDSLKSSGPLGFERALNVFIQACTALDYAHKSNVIHRDLKPSNIMLKKTESGEECVRLLDFGIAKVLPSEGADFSKTNLTQTGDVFGSPLYMSPEQCQNNPQDARSDIYALGCVMYEALTGIQPFAEDNPVKIILKHMNYEPPLVSTRLPNFPHLKVFDAVIQKCLEKDPADRYQKIYDLKRDLENIANRKPPSARLRKRFAEKRVPTRRAFIIAAIIAVIMGVSGAFLSEGLKLYTRLNNQTSDSFSEATSLDAKSYQYFMKGEFEKAAPLLEFGIATYRERVDADKKSKDAAQQLRDETLLTENIQHVGKCYLEIAKRAQNAGEKSKAKTNYLKALERYREAMKFWMRYNYSQIRNGTMAPEAVGEYRFILNELNLNDELKRLDAWAT
ncbi:serine/threonine protein kinase [Candidatus Obscuribacterales bacterium]|nr:serine/threonine protein kinase [Candidatus Obscuribacterales bacterium]